MKEESGPFVYVKGSELINYKLSMNQSLIAEMSPDKWSEISKIVEFNAAAHRKTDDEIETYYGSSNICQMTGPAGTCFLANTCGYHKGLLPVSAPRLAIIAYYAVVPCDSTSENDILNRVPLDRILPRLKEAYGDIYSDEVIRYMNRFLIK